MGTNNPPPRRQTYYGFGPNFAELFTPAQPSKPLTREQQLERELADARREVDFARSREAEIKRVPRGFTVVMAVEEDTVVILNGQQFAEVAKPSGSTLSVVAAALRMMTAERSLLVQNTLRLRAIGLRAWTFHGVEKRQGAEGWLRLIAEHETQARIGASALLFRMHDGWYAPRGCP